ncbi:MAG: CvpA family protein [Burkholderiaceae bacterium]|jgi:membrane protein required for colicin V production|nr:CvpA family protein [Burkholderiaceae bacterium]HBH36903.1 colicin V synthesis protein [Curvibacter sp.]|tara:strand:- start:285 stop:770 length:486 start_codon:yes stop_codon:yes gene_type:complete
MTVLDWLFLLGLLASIGLGVWRGFVYEVLSVLNWLLALVLAQWLGDEVGRMLPIDSGSETLIHIAGFVLVFVVSVFVGGVVVWGLPKLIEQAGLRPVDRVLGGAFGVLRAIILVLAMTVFVLMTPVKDQAWWRDSLVADTSIWSLKKLKPMLPASAGKYLP